MFVSSPHHRQLLPTAFVVLAFFALPSACVPSAHAQERRITVKGDALVEAPPDYAILKLNLEAKDRLLKRARVTHQADVSAVLAIAQKYKIAAADIAEDFPEIETRADGFLVRRTVQLTLRDLKQYDAVLFDLYDSAALTLDQAEFLLDDLLKFREQSRVMAIQAAETKAKVLAGAIKRRLGRVMNVSVESGGGSLLRGSGHTSDAPSMAMQNAVAYGPVRRSAGRSALLRVPVTSQVEVEYEIIE